MGKRKTTMIHRIRKSFLTKVIAVYLAIFMLFDIVYPTATWALTGGPTQPEMGGFSSVDTADLVDLFSGDFKYNIPLIDVDGYQLNLAYNGNVSADAEASWVGLGWSLNPGVINRSMRGIPDDFAGESITKTYSVKPSKDFGIDGGLTLELFGFDPGDMFSGSLNFGMGVNYSNYEGISIHQSIGVNFKAQVGPLTAGLGIASSNENGLTISPNVGLDLYSSEEKAKNESGTLSTTASIGIGTSYNTRAGVKQISVNASIDQSIKKNQDAAKAAKAHKEARSYTESAGSLGASGSFDLGMPTFSPQVSSDMHNISIAGNFQVGGEVFGTHPSGYIGGFYNGQKLVSTTKSNPAYGYMNLELGQNNSQALLDFSRENDGEFGPNTPALPVPSPNYDIYSVSGQGVGGSYRPFRSEVGHVFDAANYSTSEGFDIGVELGLGNLVHLAGEISVNISGTNSGKWQSGNAAANTLKYGKHGSNIDHEPYYFKEANEKSVESDPTYPTKFGGDQAVRVKLNTATNFNVLAENNFVKQDGSVIPIPSDNYRHKRDKRNEMIHSLTVKEVKDGMGLEYFPSNSYAQNAAKDYHIGQITAYNTDGMRYVYGIPAYNTKQKEVSFAAGGDMYNQGALTADCAAGTVIYSPGSDNSVNNSHGKDNYYNATETPGFAHSYLLTAVLSPDYADADTIKGPSIGDLGYYTKFSYTRAQDNYQWRTPVSANTANYNEALKTDPSDDKASYIYGTKEMWYINQVETKNYILIFRLEDRQDAMGVNDENGGLDPSQASKLLRKISLYARKDYYDQINASLTPVPLKEVHFDYDYTLCPGVPNNINTVTEGVPVPSSGPAINGKLTLKKVFFTYQNSNRSRLSPYSFEYNTSNPVYNGKSYDRWGNYKPNSGGCGVTSPLNNAEFPYVIQDQNLANDYSSSWNLSAIHLPSGGKIEVEYESDDYGYVQDKKAQRMLKIVGFSSNGTSVTSGPYTGPSVVSMSGSNDWILFETEPGYNDIHQYMDNTGQIYFKVLMQMRPGNFEYVPGYASVNDWRMIGGYGAVKLNAVNWNDSGAWGTTSPLIRSSIQFGRLHLNKFIYQNPAIGEADNFGEQVIEELFGSDLLSNLINNVTEFVKGPNKYLFDNRDVGKNIVCGKSWLRLNDPNGVKLGGGNRVKKVKMSDGWSSMTTSGQTFDYGQEYFYDDKGDGTGKSTGVASYEPQIGGEENPWKQPITYNIEHCMAPDDKMYQERPLGEAFFPSPSVGYGKVTVQNIKRTHVTRHATGKVVHEFYTAKDFPTIVEQTDRQLERDKSNPFSIASLFNIASRDYLTASQGFKVELNDMHGKPKSQNVYQEDQINPITSVEYKYKCTPYLNGSFRLDNDVTTISPNGDVSTNTVGKFSELISDFRESTSKSQTFKVNVNGENFIVFCVPVPIAPIPIPKTVKDETQFRSAATAKIIQRFGILETTIAKDLGSVVSTKNVAFDSETGETLLTQTITDFNDETFTLRYPAHWYYEKGMGQAYKNIGLTLNHTFASGIANYTNAIAYYVPGDELELRPSSGAVKQGWVVSVSANTITVVDKAGNNISGAYTAKIIRSGRRNLQSADIASITTLSNPLTNFKSNLFTNVLQASAVEFSDQWRTFCDCYTGSGEFAPFSSNPYILGTRGNWRMVKSLLHLSQRTQNHYNGNSNIRKDGMFTSYTPYYKLNFGNWMIDGKNWTYTSKVTEFSPFGQELENQDALGRYSAATFGYRQTFATSVAANARYRDIGFDNFEDYGFSPCADNHFKFTDYAGNVSSAQSHSGLNSIKVSSGTVVKMAKALEICDPLGCNITVSGADNHVISGGSAPYNIQYDVLYGNPSISLGSSSFIISSGGTLYSVNITITDAQGCQYTTNIHN